MKRSYVTLVLRLSRRWVNEICAGDYRFDGRVPWARFQNERDCEICCRESSFYEERRRVRAQIANVIRELEAMGCLSRHMPASQRGRYTLYRWCSCNVLNQVSESAKLSSVKC